MSSNKTKRKVLFHRFFNIYGGGTSGGQIKVRDSFEHIRQSDEFTPRVYFNSKTKWFDNPGNVWRPYKDSSDEIQHWKPENGDILFFAGVDWMIFDEKERDNPPVPVLNIAHPRHTRAGDKRNKYLHHPAIRITKSTLSKKILDHYGVNGPVYVIPDAIDPDDFPEPNPAPDIDILIVGLKNPVVARQIYKSLNWLNRFRRDKLNIHVQLPPKLPTRSDFLNLVNRAKMVVYLPLEKKFGAEGFYLPALEGMFMEKLVVCPFAVGNVDFCIHGETCIMPKYNVISMLNGIRSALAMSAAERSKMISNGKKITENHLIHTERQSLLNLLDQVDDIWSQKDLFQGKK